VAGCADLFPFLVERVWSLMFLYGHMLREGHVFDYTLPDGTSVTVKVMDAWPSLMHHDCSCRNDQGACLLGARWVELWTASEDDVSRMVAIVLVPSFEHFYEVKPKTMGTSASKYAWSAAN
jgi:hypothetical protein